MLGVVALPAAAHEEDESYPLDFTQAPDGVLPWGELAKVGVMREGGRIEVRFLPPVLALEGKPVTLYGYMTTVDQGTLHKRFLISMQPLFCRACTLPITPDGIVEVNMVEPMAARDEALAVRGTLALVRNDPNGLIYRLVAARVVTRADARAP